MARLKLTLDLDENDLLLMGMAVEKARQSSEERVVLKAPHGPIYCRVEQRP